MTSRCPNEHELMAAIRSGKVTDGMRRHLDGCPACRQIASLTEQLGAVAASLPVPEPIDPAALIHRAGMAAKDSWDQVRFPIWIVDVMWAVTAMTVALVSLFPGQTVLPRVVQWIDCLPGVVGLTGLSASVMRLGSIFSLVLAVLLPLSVVATWLRDLLHDRPTAHDTR